MRATTEMDKVSNRKTKAIERLLAKHFQKVDAYLRRHLRVIRVRVVDERFQGKTNSQREDEVFPLLEKLPEDIRSDITFLLLLTPEELTAPKNVLNAEFEEPLPSFL